MNTPIKFELAKLLKEKLFSWECENFYKKGKHDKKFYLSTGIEYDSDKNLIWDWNLHGGKSGMLTKIIPYPNEDSAIYYSAPTIAEIVMWLYEKHEIWIQVKPGGKLETWDFIVQKKDNTFAVSYFEIKQHKPFFNSPTEAYEEGIKYVLNNMNKKSKS